MPREYLPVEVVARVRILGEDDDLALPALLVGFRVAVGRLFE
jgi:hypothetical protein